MLPRVPARSQRLRSKIAAAVLASTLPALAAAHDFWAERAGEGFVVRYGHRGGELLPIDPATVRAVRCDDGRGAPRELRADARASPAELRVPGACAVLTVVSDQGFWSLTPDGEVNLPRTAVRDALKSWSSRQFAKWVDARSPRAAAVQGDDLEIVPASDLARARAGDKITLRVLSGGEAVAGARVAVGHRTLGETDSKGQIRVRLREAGTESISASLRRARPTPEADAEVLEASLTFEVAG